MSNWKSTAVLISKDKFLYTWNQTDDQILWIHFLCLGTPLPIVVAAVASSYKYYGVKGNGTDNLI